jgi:hypothetical protein
MDQNLIIEEYIKMIYLLPSLELSTGNQSIIYADFLLLRAQISNTI